MAKVQVIPLDISTLDKDDLVVANLATQTKTPESLWVLNGSDIVVDNTIPCRAGCFVAKKVLLDTDTSDDSLAVQSDTDVVPTISSYYPDIYWAVNGLDLIPRGD